MQISPLAVVQICRNEPSIFIRHKKCLPHFLSVSKIFSKLCFNQQKSLCSNLFWSSRLFAHHCLDALTTNTRLLVQEARVRTRLIGNRAMYGLFHQKVSGSLRMFHRNCRVKKRSTSVCFWTVCAFVPFSSVSDNIGRPGYGAP